MEQFLTALASAAPTPGGGSAAAMAAAMAAALGEMTMGIAARRGKANEADVEAFRTLRMALVAGAAADAAAYDAVLRAIRMDRRDPARAEALAKALADAARVPLQNLECIVTLRRLLRQGEAVCPPSAATDYEAAFHLLDAATKILIANVEVNLHGAADAEQLRRALEDTRATLAGIG